MFVIHIARDSTTGEVIAVGETAAALHFGIAGSNTSISDIELEVLNGEEAEAFRERRRQGLE